MSNKEFSYWTDAEAMEASDRIEREYLYGHHKVTAGSTLMLTLIVVFVVVMNLIF